MAIHPYPSHIRKYEIGLQFREGDLAEVLDPGRVPFRLRSMFSRSERLEVLNTWDTQLVSRDLEAWITMPALADRLEIVRLGVSERAIVWRDGQVYKTLGPGLHAFWKAPATVRVDRYDLDASLALEAPGLARLVELPALKPFVRIVRAATGSRVGVFIDGELVELIDKGMRAYWRTEQAFDTKIYDMREQLTDVASQDIMTRDKVSLRTSLVVTWRIADLPRVIGTTPDYAGALYREAQLALRAVIGTRTLDQLLADKDLVNERLFALLEGRARTLGLEVLRLGIKDILLPGEMKTILNRVITAQKEAEANVIRRREETAAARSQANTAKLLASNPTLARMRELEALGEVLRGMKATFVLGPANIAEQVSSLLADDGGEDPEA